jgi:predicted HTH transcriptional regulator
MKLWLTRMLERLGQSLSSPPRELNDLDWKQELSPNKKRLIEHLSAFANNPGGGGFVFGVSNAGQPVGIKDGIKPFLVQRGSFQGGG